MPGHLMVGKRSIVEIMAYSVRFGSPVTHADNCPRKICEVGLNLRWPNSSRRVRRRRHGYGMSRKVRLD
jgi:hypothetical protein